MADPDKTALDAVEMTSGSSNGLRCTRRRLSRAHGERTKFISYLIYSAIISAVIIDLRIVGVGWGCTRRLMARGPAAFDYAGSTVDHAWWLVRAGRAIVLGPRIGKYAKLNAPGVPATTAMACLGVFTCGSAGRVQSRLDDLTDVGEFAASP